MLFMDIIYDKPFKTIEEQIEIISNRNVQIEDSPFVRESLESISYYTLMNGYKDSFLADRDGENFQDGTTFNMIYTLHWIDISLSNIIFKYILLVEKSLKTKIAHLVGEKYGVEKNDYLFHRNYSNPNGSRNGTLNDIRDLIKYCKKNSSLSYYKLNKNHVPPWIIVNDMMFGLTIQWYSILKGNDKEEICEKFIGDIDVLSICEKKELLRKSLDILRAFRNKVAHGSRIFNLDINEELPKKQIVLLTNGILSAEEYDHGLGKNDLFAVLIALCILINDPIILTNIMVELTLFLSPYKEKNILFIDKTLFELFGLPEDILERIDKLVQQQQQ